MSPEIGEMCIRDGDILVYINGNWTNVSVNSNKNLLDKIPINEIEQYIREKKLLKINRNEHENL